jgi:preprotein translocase subunit SecF
MIEFLKNTKFDFIGKRHIAYIVSILLLINAIYAVVLLSTNRAKVGLDFTGGSNVQLKFTKDVTVGQIRDVMTKNGIPEAVIQQLGTPQDKEFLIRIGSKDAEAGQAEQKVTSILKQATMDDGIQVLGTSEIGPVVSAQLKEKAFLAVFWAIVGILVYIWIRFQFKFAVAATIATFHDVFVVLGVMVLLGREIDLLTITALLTLAGYSLTDTVVVFDRIRENMRNILKMKYNEIINNSINQVLSRSIITSLMVLVVSLSLFIFGGNVLNNFSLVMVLGVIVGTYSSVFVASPIVYEWEEAEKKNRASTK